MHRFTVQDDYDKVPDVAPVPVMTGPDGRPIEAHLLAKPKAFVEEDRAKADSKLKLTEEALFRSPEAVDQAGAGANPNPATARRYVTNDTKIGRANQVLDG